MQLRSVGVVSNGNAHAIATQFSFLEFQPFKSSQEVFGVRMVTPMICDK